MRTLAYCVMQRLPPIGNLGCFGTAGSSNGTWAEIEFSTSTISKKFGLAEKCKASTECKVASGHLTLTLNQTSWCYIVLQTFRRSLRAHSSFLFPQSCPLWASGYWQYCRFGQRQDWCRNSRSHCSDPARCHQLHNQSIHQ